MLGNNAQNQACNKVKCPFKGCVPFLYRPLPWRQFDSCLKSLQSHQQKHTQTHTHTLTCNRCVCVCVCVREREMPALFTTSLWKVKGRRRMPAVTVPTRLRTQSRPLPWRPKQSNSQWCRWGPEDDDRRERDRERETGPVSELLVMIQILAAAWYHCCRVMLQCVEWLVCEWIMRHVSDWRNTLR